MGITKSKPRSADRGRADQRGYAASWLSPAIYRTASRVSAVESQKKIDARRTKPPSGGRKHRSTPYPIEVVNEAVAMMEAGWTIKSVEQVTGIKYATLRNWKNGITRAPSSVSI